MSSKKFFYVSVGILAITVAYAMGLGRTESAALAMSAPVETSVASQLQDEFAAVAAKVNPTVVNIEVERPANGSSKYRFYQFEPFGHDTPLPPELKHFFGFPGRPREGGPGRPNRGPQELPKGRGAGSGVVIDAARGYIVTNNHVVRDATKIDVTLQDGSSHEGELVGADPRTDLAVIRISAKGLEEIEFGDSEDLQVGHMVLAFGQPEGLKYTVTQGIISGLGRTNLGIIRGPEGAVGYEDFIQTDAAVNPGNSGGPLTDIHGRLVGINAAIATAGIPQFGGISFAIPVNIVRDITRQLIESGEVVRGWIGVTIGNLSDQPGEIVEKYDTDGSGVYVASVAPGQPAAEAGMMAEDVIVRFDGRDVEDTQQLRNTVAAAEVGGTVKAEVVRVVDGKPKRMTLEIKIAKQPKDLTLAVGGAVTTDIGLSVQTLDPRLAKALGYDEDEKGVVVAEVVPESRAAKADIRAGDLINHVKFKGEGRDIESVSDFESALTRIPEGEPFALRVKREGRVRFVPVE